MPLLATIDADGGVTAVPLSGRRGEGAAIRTALDGSDPSERANLAFAAMATYSQVSLQPDGRLRLSPPLALHLCAVPEGRVWVGAYRDAIRLSSYDIWYAAGSSSGVQLGYLSAERCGWIGLLLSEGSSHEAIFQDLFDSSAAIRVRFGGGSPALPPRLQPSGANDDFEPDPDPSIWGA